MELNKGILIKKFNTIFYGFSNIKKQREKNNYLSKLNFDKILNNNSIA